MTYKVVRRALCGVALRHRASGTILDFRYLQTITVYEDFAALCTELENYEVKKDDIDK